MANIYTFKRVEKKYILNSEQFTRLKNRLKEHFHKDTKGSTRIHNIYFDNDSNELINISVSKPVYKEKLRLRSYTSANDDTQVFFEIKKKFKKTVYKRRISCTYKQIKDYIKTGIADDIDNNPTLREISYLMHHYNLKPKTYLSYKREAFFSNTDPDLRITFDYDIKSRTDNLCLLSSDDDKALLCDGTYIMEIKANNAIPLFLSRILSQEQIYPQSFSKIGNIHKQNITGGEYPCFTAY